MEWRDEALDRSCVSRKAALLTRFAHILTSDLIPHLPRLGQRRQKINNPFDDVNTNTSSASDGGFVQDHIYRAS